MHTAECVVNIFYKKAGDIMQDQIEKLAAEMGITFAEAEDIPNEPPEDVIVYE